MDHALLCVGPMPMNVLLHAVCAVCAVWSVWSAADGSLVWLDFGMMSEAPGYARFAIMAHVVHLVNR